MKLALLLAVLGWCALVHAQGQAPDYDYYDYGEKNVAAVAQDTGDTAVEAVLGDAEAAAETEAASPDEPSEAVPVTDPSVETTTIESDASNGRKKLVSLTRNADRRGKRPSIIDRRPSAAATATTTTTTTEQPSSGVVRGSSRFSRPSRRQQTQAVTESATEAESTTAGRSFSRNRFRSSTLSRTSDDSGTAPSPSSPSTSSSSSSKFSPRRSFSRPTATSTATEAPKDTSSHRFSPRRRFQPKDSVSTDNEEEQQQEATTEAAFRRFGRRRQA